MSEVLSDPFRRLYHEINNFRRETGQWPKYLYLGHEEYRDMVYTEDSMRRVTHLMDGRTRVSGLDVFLVCVDSHFGLGL